MRPAIRVQPARSSACCQQGPRSPSLSAAQPGQSCFLPPTIQENRATQPRPPALASAPPALVPGAFLPSSDSGYHPFPPPPPHPGGRLLPSALCPPPPLLPLNPQTTQSLNQRKKSNQNPAPGLLSARKVVGNRPPPQSPGASKGGCTPVARGYSADRPPAVPSKPPTHTFLDLRVGGVGGMSPTAAATAGLPRG